MSKMINTTDKVTFHYELVLDDGRIAHSTRSLEHPAQLSMGDGQLPEPFERCLVGLTIGQRQDFILEVNDAFGPVRAEQIMHMHRHDFASALELSEGLVVAFSRPDGTEMPGVIQTIAGDSVTVDFNHPLAGERIHFKVEILNIQINEQAS